METARGLVEVMPKLIYSLSKLEQEILGGLVHHGGQSEGIIGETWSGCS